MIWILVNCGHASKISGPLFFIQGTCAKHKPSPGLVTLLPGGSQFWLLAPYQLYLSLWPRWSWVQWPCSACAGGHSLKHQSITLNIEHWHRFENSGVHVNTHCTIYINMHVCSAMPARNSLKRQRFMNIDEHSCDVIASAMFEQHQTLNLKIPLDIVCKKCAGRFYILDSAWRFGPLDPVYVGPTPLWPLKKFCTFKEL